MASPTLAILPELYPLSASMIKHLALERHIQQIPSIPFEVTLSFNDQIEYLRQEYLKTWQPLKDEVIDLREQACSAILPALEKSTLSTTNFLDVLQSSSKKRRDAQAMTLSRWRGRGLLRFDDRGKVNIETATAILMMTLAFKNKQNFLPPGKHEEPYMYIWAKKDPASVPMPHGLPLQNESPLTNHTLLYTPWTLLGKFNREWLSFGNYGSIRWASTIQADEQLLWNLDDNAIRLWDPTIAQLSNPSIPQSVQLQIRHTLANLILLKQANEHLVHL